MARLLFPPEWLGYVERFVVLEQHPLCTRIPSETAQLSRSLLEEKKPQKPKTFPATFKSKVVVCPSVRLSALVSVTRLEM